MRIAPAALVVAALAAGDNVVTSSDAVDTFGLPLVPLDEQLRRSV